jgi:hypothetical protein
MFPQLFKNGTTNGKRRVLGRGREGVGAVLEYTDWWDKINYIPPVRDYEF